jgi:thioester reductase-like protein
VLQLHMDFQRFRDFLPRVRLWLGDITRPRMGLSTTQRQRLAHSTTSVIRAAAPESQVPPAMPRG